MSNNETRPYQEPHWLRLRLVSDGTSAGTRVLDAETGRPLFGVVSVTWEGTWDYRNQPPRVRLVLEQVAADLTDTGAITRRANRPRPRDSEGDNHA